MDSTTVFETVRRGSTPWRGTRHRNVATGMVLGVCWTARDFAKVVDQVRFLARTLVRSANLGVGVRSVRFALLLNDWSALRRLFYVVWE